MKRCLGISALFCLQFAAIAQTAQTQSLQGHVPAALAQLSAVGRLDGSRELKLAIGLPLRNKEGLTNLLQRVYDPASPDYHHYLTPAQFAERFGPTEEDYRAVRAFAAANGLKVTATHSNRTLLEVTGSVSNIEKAFHVTLRTYAHPREKREFYAPDVEPSLDLATPVLHISGLDNYLLPHPMSLRRKPAGLAAGAGPASGSGPQGGFMGNDFRAAYVPGLALTGAGQSVGLVEFDGFFPSDITNYALIAGIPAVPLKTVLLDGFNGVPGGGNIEVALDIDMAVCMAPGLLSVIVYEGELPDDVLNRMATDDLANQLSASWTYPIDAETEQIFLQFAAQGQSFFNAAGDDDAYVGPVYPPSDDPNLTCVGGTTLTTSGPGGAWVSETVWNWDVEYGAEYDGEGTGGGISTTYPIPSWQLGLSMTANQGSTNFRNCPDVAMVADNVFLVADDGETGSVGGTSCATPLWAAFIALANQQGAANGRPPLGFINPAIYALGQSANYSSCFHDITTGNNTWSESPTNFYAVAGYDLCTGWGTPAGSNLVNVLAPRDSLQISLLGGLASSGAVGGPLTPASQTYLLTNVGNAALYWAAASTVPWLNVSLTGGALTPGGGAATVVVSLNTTASNLFLGSYGGAVWFTNLTDGATQSRPVSLLILKPPVITAQPASLTLIGGTTATFTASAAGGLPLACQWQFNGTNLTNGGRISGSQTTLTGAGNLYGSVASALTISNLAAADGGTYALVASNAAGVVISSNAVLTVTPSAPVIVQQPASQTALVGATVQMAVVAEGTAPFSYQWMLNGASLTDGGDLSGSLTPTLTINGASSANIGTYTILVSNSISTATSTGAVLTVQVAEPGQQLVQNGGFETGSFSSWDETGNFVDCSVSSSAPAVFSGQYGALLGPSGSLGYLSQSLPTTAGEPCLLSLWLDSPDGLSPNEFLVAWNGTVMFDQTNLGAFGWTNLQFYVTATGANTLLQFGFRDDQSFLGLDAIQVIPLVSADGPPIIATQPANQVALQGGAASFSVLAAGQLPLFYQWQFDGANLANATNATLSLTNLTNTQAGSYSVLVSNSLNWTTSSNALLTIPTGSAALITFDDLPGPGSDIPPGYHNLTWSNFYYLNAMAYGQPSGYLAGMISASNVAYNGYGPAAMVASGPFDLLSAYLTAAWNDNLRVEVQGFTGAVLTYDNTYTLSATTPALITFNYVGVTQVQFISSGGTQHPGYLGSGLEFVLDNMTVVPAPPTPMSVLYSFNGPDGGFPAAALAQGADGNFYGVASYGGLYGDGTVFKMTTNGALTTLLSFDYSNGAYPSAGLVQGADGNLYGTTPDGGTSGYGTVFKMKTSGALTTLLSFDGSDGGYPQAGLAQGADGYFYGTTSEGGANGDGTVFKITPNGALTTLYSFGAIKGTNDVALDGSNPSAPLVQGSDGNFYGTTESGGSYDYYGTVFKITTNGALTTLLSFDFTDGGYPQAGLAQGADGYFYGTTSAGGANYSGTVFKMATNGALTTLYSFDYSDGGSPQAGLIQGADGNFYGTTSSGGAYFNGAESVYANGTVFKMTTNGMLTTLLSLEGTNGSSPQCGLLQGADGNFYGTTTSGGRGFNGSGSSGDGIVFRIGAAPTTAPAAIVAQPAGRIVPLNGTAVFSVTAGGAAPLSYSWELNGVPIAGAAASTYTTNNVPLPASGGQFRCVISNAYGSVTSSNATLTVFNGSGPLYSFNGPDGGNSSAPLIQGPNGNFYGTTAYGGTNGQGEIFSLTANGTLSILASFTDYLNGSYPQAGLVQGADGNFYGTTSGGGAYDYGTVFKITPTGTLTTLHSFDYSDGYSPVAGLVQGADGNFYGTTEYGGYGYYGTVFKITTNGALTTLLSFDNSNGGDPEAVLVQGADGNFYGTTSAGGTDGYGTVFKMKTNGALTTLLSFNYSDGAYPYAGLAQGPNGYFYGATSGGGTNGFGTLFKMTTNGALTSLLSFDYSNGAYPYAALVQGADGNFYGTTESGGTNGDGTVFKMTPNGTFSSLFSFEATNGLYPQAALLQASDGNFYSTTTYGGVGFDASYQSGNGTVFRLLGAPAAPPLISAQPLSQTVLVGGAATFNVTASGSPTLFYFWSRNGVPIAGAATNSYTTNNVQLTDSGALFSCLVSNAYGTNLSSNATLTVTVTLPPTNLVQNGGFELGTFADWTTSGNFDDCAVTANAPYVHSGEYGAQLGPVESLGYLSQTLATTVGQQYLVSCWLYCDGLIPNEFSVSWNGATLFDQVNIGATGWTNLQFQAGATLANTVLTFGFRDDLSYFGLDDISVYPLLPPQPQAPAWTNGTIRFSWGTQAGQTYQVQYTTNLAQIQWTDLGGLLSPTNSSITVTDVTTASSARFYRIILDP